MTRISFETKKQRYLFKNSPGTCLITWVGQALEERSHCMYYTAVDCLSASALDQMVKQSLCCILSHGPSTSWNKQAEAVCGSTASLCAVHQTSYRLCLWNTPKKEHGCAAILNGTFLRINQITVISGLLSAPEYKPHALNFF